MLSTTKSELLHSLTGGALLAIRMVALGLLSGPGVFIFAAFYVKINPQNQINILSEEAGVKLCLVNLFVFVLFSFLSGKIENSILNKIRNTEGSGEVVGILQKAYLTKLVFIESAAIFSITVGFITPVEILKTRAVFWSLPLAYLYLLYEGFKILIRSPEETIRFIKAKTGIVFY